MMAPPPSPLEGPMFRSGHYVASHPHGTYNTAGYLAVLTDWTGGFPCARTVVAEFDGATSYGAALAAVKVLRASCTPTQYAVVDTVYTCGCDSHAYSAAKG